MPVVFAACVSHAPGSTAWTDEAPPEQKDTVFGGYARIADALYAAGVDPGCSDELDHGTMVSVHFAMENAPKPIVPVIVNTLSKPMPSPESGFRFDEAVGIALADLPAKVALVATGGLSHTPGERRQGVIDSDFGAEFLHNIATGNHAALRAEPRAHVGRRRGYP